MQNGEEGPDPSNYELRQGVAFTASKKHGHACWEISTRMEGVGQAKSNFQRTS